MRWKLVVVPVLALSVRCCSFTCLFPGDLFGQRGQFAFQCGRRLFEFLPGLGSFKSAYEWIYAVG